MITDAKFSDASNIKDVYNYYIENSISTFEEKAVSKEDIQNRILKVHQQNLPYLVAYVDGEFIGYAYASIFQKRSAYRFTAELTVYLKPNNTIKGVAAKLYEEIFKRLKQRNIKTVLAAIALPNKNSVRLHEKFGMKKVAHLKDVGFKFSNFIDVGYWQKEI